MQLADVYQNDTAQIFILNDRSTMSFDKNAIFYNKINIHTEEKLFLYIKKKKQQENVRKNFFLSLKIL